MNARIELLQLKQQALDIRHDLDHLVDFYRQFQALVEIEAAALAGTAQWDAAAERQQAVVKREFEANHGNRFLQWSNGEEVYISSVYHLIHEPGIYQKRPDIFANEVQDAAVAFEGLFRDRERELRQLHDHIALVEGEDAARRVTTLALVATPTVAPAAPADADTGSRLGRVEEVADKVYTWGDRIVSFLPWAYHIAALIRGAIS